MTSIAEQYTSEIGKGLHYLAAWVPQTRITIGDIGTIEQRAFVPWSSLRSVGYEPAAFGLTPWGPKAPLTYQSASGVSISIKGKGEVSNLLPNVPKGSAGAAVKFGREGAVMFAAKGCRSRRIDEGLGLRETILRLYDRGLWDRNWLLVTEVVEAESATILVSSGQNASIELKAKGTVSDIADLSAGVSAVFASGVQTRIVSEKSLTPLFRAVRVNEGWWQTTVDNVSFGVEPVDYSKMLEAVDTT